MSLDLNKKSKTKKTLLKKTVAAIVLSNLLQLAIHLSLREETPPAVQGPSPPGKGSS